MLRYFLCLSSNWCILKQDPYFDSYFPQKFMLSCTALGPNKLWIKDRIKQFVLSYFHLVKWLLRWWKACKTQAWFLSLEVMTDELNQKRNWELPLKNLQSTILLSAMVSSVYNEAKTKRQVENLSQIVEIFWGNISYKSTRFITFWTWSRQWFFSTTGFWKSLGNIRQSCDSTTRHISNK